MWFRHTRLYFNGCASESFDSASFIGKEESLFVFTQFNVSSGLRIVPFSDNVFKSLPLILFLLFSIGIVFYSFTLSNSYK